MTEATFRAVVAAVLVGLLVLAAVVVGLAVARPQLSPQPSTETPSPSASVAVPPASPQIPAASPVPRHVFGDIAVTGVGDIPRGGRSAATLVLHMAEPDPAAIPNGPGSFLVTLTDHAGAGSTLTLTGTPSIYAPGSLGVRVDRQAGNVLRVTIQGSDPRNIEPIVISGLGIDVAATAALGPMSAVASGFEGSLAGGVAMDTLPSPGTVVAGP
jgi:hypothetical protein